MTQSPNTPEPISQPSMPPRRRVRRGWPAMSLVLLSLVLLCLVSITWAIGGLGGNVRAVVPGYVYRSAQITGSGVGALTACWTGRGLEQVIKQDGIKTVLNLRGGDDGQAWYRQEREICTRLGVDHIDISMSAIHAPHPLQLKRVLDVFDHARYPILFHCQGGSDRSGLVGTLYLNIYQNMPLSKAERQQLTMRYAHFKFTRTRAMDDFFDLYRQTIHHGNSQDEDLRNWITYMYPILFAQMPEEEKSGPPTTQELLANPSPLATARHTPGEGQSRALVPGG